MFIIFFIYLVADASSFLAWSPWVLRITPYANCCCSSVIYLAIHSFSLLVHVSLVFFLPVLFASAYHLLLKVLGSFLFFFVLLAPIPFLGFYYIAAVRSLTWNQTCTYISIWKGSIYRDIQRYQQATSKRDVVQPLYSTWLNGWAPCKMRQTGI